MSNNELMREVLNRPITPELLEERRAAGWRPVAIEWQREGTAGQRLTQIPYGLKVAADGQHLAEDTGEMEVLRIILSHIVRDRALSEIAEALGERGHRRRDGRPWSQSAVFDLLPRLVEVAPSIYASEAWRSERLRPAV